MYYCLLTREQLLDFLPKGARVAEVGVFRGDFSAQVLARAEPRELCLVDAWELATDRDYADQLAFLPEKDGAEVLAGVRQRFAGPIADGRVRIHRGYSRDLAPGFAPGSFDWVYIDADHRYQAVLEDLRLYGGLVKEDGLLLGHDFVETTHPPARDMGFGVTRAVREFLGESGFRMLLLSDGVWATYCLTRNPQSAACRGLIHAIALAGYGVMEMPGIDRFTLDWEFLGVADGKNRFLRRFRWL